MPDSNQTHGFAHEAMNTEFLIDIRASEQTAEYARQAAAAAFRELDIIEGHLSRFIQSSDVSRINKLTPGEGVVVDPYTFECLEIALQLNAETAGAFDVTFRSRSGRPLKHLFELDRDRLCVLAHTGGLEIDLGAIGKGYALDCMAELLREWDVDSALLRSSYSTVLAMEPPPSQAGWEAGFGRVEQRVSLELANQALSGSGIEMQGQHVKNPLENTAAAGYRAWALAERAAHADGLSTAFMVMGKDEVRKYIDGHPHLSAWVQSDKNAPIERMRC